MTDKKTTDIDGSQVGVAGDGTKVKNGIHVKKGDEIDADGRDIAVSKDEGFAAIIKNINVFFSKPAVKSASGKISLFFVWHTVLTSLILTLILCKVFPVEAAEKLTYQQMLLNRLTSSGIFIVLCLVIWLISGDRNIRIIIFVVIPLYSMGDSLASSCDLLNKSPFEIVTEIAELFQSDNDPPSSDSEKDIPAKPVSVPQPAETPIQWDDTPDEPAKPVTSDPREDIPASRPPEAPDLDYPVPSPRQSAVSEERHSGTDAGQSVMTPSEPEIINDIGMSFVYIPPGTFLMGSPEGEPGRYSDEKQHEVTLTEGFYMQTTEVTQEQWQQIMGENPARFKDCGPDCPVEMVSWNDVQIFIGKLNQRDLSMRYRLPTEAQWEYVCRSRTKTRYCTGDTEDDLDRVGWYDRNSGGKMPVGEKEPNAWGLYDMHGNLWEWCQDWYGGYPAGPVTDPTGPDSGDGRVMRGGSWGFNAQFCRSAYRRRFLPDLWHDSAGFRLVLTISDDERFKLAIELLKIACVSGEEISIEGNVDGGISFLKKGGKGSVKLSKTDVKEVVRTVNESIRAEENQQIRECMQPHIAKILNIIATSPDNEPPKEKTFFLPKNQWLPVEMPLSIIDGKVLVIIKFIKEGSYSKSRACIEVELPRRGMIWDDKMYNNDTLSFKYYDTEYKLTVMNIDLHRQRAKITIIEM